jgi:hypothetical protein
MKKFLASFGSFAKLKKVFSYGERIRPARDWYLLLSIAGILLVIGVVWNVFLFNELENGKSLQSSIPAQSHPIANSSITAVQAVFQKRATEENNYQNVYHFVDPSVPGS